MLLEVRGKNNYNGFLLSEPFTHEGNLVVLTGRNGCGKTRFLESLQKQRSVMFLAYQRLKGSKMSKKQNSKETADKVVHNIKRQTRRKFNAEEKIRIVLWIALMCVLKNTNRQDQSRNRHALEIYIM